MKPRFKTPDVREASLKCSWHYDVPAQHWKLTWRRGPRLTTSVQLLPDSGHTLVGWGYVPAYTEFDSDGSVLCDVPIAPWIFWGFGWVKSYRAFQSSSWVGRPSSPPDTYLRPRDGLIYVSWNGATEAESLGTPGPRADS